jgi:predicted amidohydrolase YtcJ
MRELNRLGITSAIDAGGGFQNYPDDYQVIEQLHKNDELTVRIAYNLFTQKPKGELADFQTWSGMLNPRQGNDYLRHNGGGEMLVFSAADFEDFLEPRPDMPGAMEQELKPVVSLLARNRWPFRLHATYDETITRALNVYEDVNREIPLHGLHWFIDHAETISQRNMDRIAVLGGGIAIQHRMAFQGEYFRDRYGKDETNRTPPIREMLRAGLPVGAGTDATRVATYNPFVSLYWLVTGKTVGGLSMYDERQRFDRMEALRLWTVGSSWFSTEQGTKGSIVAGQLADLAVLSADYFSVDEEEIKNLESVLTIVGGNPVYAAEEFAEMSPPLPPILPEWSPVAAYGGYFKHATSPVVACSSVEHVRSSEHRPHDHPLDGGFGCLCWAF